MADINTFRTLQEDSEDRKYPRDNSDLRQAHADYASGLLARVKAEEGVIIAALSAKQDPEWNETSQFAKDHPMEQVLTGFAEVEDSMSRQKQRADEGKTVTLLDGKRRRVLGQAMAGLFAHMKTFYNSGGEIKARDATVVDFVKEVM